MQEKHLNVLFEIEWPLCPKYSKTKLDIKSNIFFNRNPTQVQYKEGLYILETMFCVFLCSVQDVIYEMYYQPI